MTDQTLVKTYTGAQVIGTGSTINVSWDGTSDNPALYPTGVAPMGKGIYIFAWNVGTQGTGGDCDQDKSASLSISQTDSYIAAYDETTDLNTADDSDVLTDINLAPANSAQVTVYYPDLSVAAGPKTMPTAVNAPGAANPAADEIQFSMSLSQDGWYTHLFAAQDNDLTTDKGHRQRWALQKNIKPAAPRADDFDEITATNPYTDTDAAHLQKFVIVGILANGSIRHSAYAAFPKGLQLWSTVLDAMSHDALISLNGHANSGQFDCAGDPAFNGGSATIFAQNGLPGQSIAGKDFHTLSIVVFEGCNSANTDINFGNLLLASVAAGAGCAVGFTMLVHTYYVETDSEDDLSPSRVWSEAFWRALAVGETTFGTAGTPDSVALAVQYAARQVRADMRSGGSFMGFDSYAAQGNSALTAADGLKHPVS